MSTVPSSRQNPDEFHGLHEQDATNTDRGQRAAQHDQPAPAGKAEHQHAPNYGDFGHDAPTPHVAAQNRSDEDSEGPDQTHHGDDRFRHSGTRNWDTDEPANPHHGAES